MQKQLEQVAIFQKTFNQQVEEAPTLIRKDVAELRFRLMKEENEEYLEAVENDDMVEIADALGDMLYVLCGTILEHGMQHKIEEVFEEIQKSNMSKLDENGKPIFREDGKILKGSGFFNPDIKRILREE